MAPTTHPLPDSMDVRNVPPIPLSLADRAGRYTETRSASLSSWHPTRHEALISTRFGDVAQVHHVRAPLGARKQLTFFRERVSRATFQPVTGEYFVFSRDRGGDEMHQNFRYDVATGDVTLLTDGAAKNSRGVWSTAGDRMCYTSTRRNGADADLFVVRPDSPGADDHRCVAQVKGGGWFPCSWAPDDRTIIVNEYVSITETYLWLLTVDTGEMTRLTAAPADAADGAKKEKKAATVAYSAPTFARDGKGFYVTCDRDGEFRQLYYVDLAAKAYTPLSAHIAWDVESVALSHDGKRLAFTANENGIDRLHLLDTATNAEVPLPADVPVGLIFALRWHRDNRTLGFTVTAARSASDVYAVDVEAGTLTRWTESETGGLNTGTFAQPELISWPSFDGRTITGFLYRPPGKKDGEDAKETPGCPLMIDIHGGPEGQFQPCFLGRYNYYLNELGVALLFPNVRGSAGYGKTFLQLDNGYLREDSVKDIGALLDWVSSAAGGGAAGLDSARVLVTGGSYGGYMSLAVATHYSERIVASIDIVGISNFVTFLENTKSYRRDLRRAKYGDERDPDMRKFLISISPTSNAHKIKKPLFVVHGANDPRVPLGEADQIVQTLEKHDVPVWYMVANDEGHGFAKKKNGDVLFYSTIQFVKKFLVNEK